MDLDKLFQLNPSAIVWDGFDEAIIGMASKELNGPIIITYVEENEYQSFEILPNLDDEFDRWGRQSFGPIIAYNTDKIIEILMSSMIGEDDLDDSPYMVALDYFEFNINDAWVGEFTPLHVSNKENE